MKNKDIKILVVLGTTREPRMSELVSNAVLKMLSQRGINTELLDIKKLDLPLFIKKDSKKAKPLLDLIGKQDGFIFVTPEYNNSFPGVLKNALDYLDRPLTQKAASVVGVSNGQMGGVRAVMHLRDVLLRLDATMIPSAVYFSNVDEAFNEQGQIINIRHQKSLNRLLDDLIWHAQALKDKRNKTEINHE